SSPRPAAAGGRACRSATSPASATTSCTTPTCRSSARTTRAGPRSTRWRRSSTRWCTPSAGPELRSTADMRVTIVNQFFPPDLAPTAHLAASLARHRAAQGDEVTVVTSRGDYVTTAGGPSGAVELPTGRGPGRVRVVRLRIPGGGKSSVLTRLEGYAGFTVGAWIRL